jgi:hypothetical protein
VKNFRKLTAVSAVLVALLVSGLAIGQSNVTEVIGQMVFRSASPFIKFAGTLSLTDLGALEILKLVPTAAAVNEVSITNAATSSGPSIAATGGDTNIDVTLAGKGTGSLLLGQSTSTGIKLVADQPLLDSSGLELVKFSKTATAVNEVTIANAATGNGPTLSATGETNVDLNLAAKGTGAIKGGGYPLTGVRHKAVVGTDATVELTANDCGNVYVATATSGTQTYTLPAATNAGCMFTFIAGHAGGEILIDAAADAQGFVVTTFAAVGADADTSILTEADGAPGIKNTAGTNAIGDSLTIVADGTLTWLGVGISTGIWAAQ